MLRSVMQRDRNIFSSSPFRVLVPSLLVIAGTVVALVAYVLVRLNALAEAHAVGENISNEMVRLIGFAGGMLVVAIFVAAVLAQYGMRRQAVELSSRFSSVLEKRSDIRGGPDAVLDAAAQSFSR